MSGMVPPPTTNLNQLRQQLAACGRATLHNSPLLTKGSYAWTPQYALVVSLRERFNQVVEVLRSVEWGATDDMGDEYCPICGGYKKGIPARGGIPGRAGGHAEDCALRAALKNAK